jgi:hypothetical protein
MTNSTPSIMIKAELVNLFDKLQHPDLLIKRSGLTLKIFEKKHRKHSAEIATIFINKASAFYLQCSIFDGNLQQEILSLNLPKNNSNLLCNDIYLHSTLGERNREFSPDQGGARYIYQNSNFHEIANDTVNYIVKKYISTISCVLNIESNLDLLVIKNANYFSYPLGILAILQKRNISTAFLEMLTSGSIDKQFKKECGFNYKEMLQII